MQILNFNGNAGNLTVGVIGTEEQGVEIKSRVLARCDETVRERISFLVPKEGVSAETMISGAENTCRRGGSSSSILWLACVIPELFPEHIVWPSEVLFISDYVSKDNPFFEKISFVPRFATIDEFASIIHESLHREISIERSNMEIAKLRAEKFKLNKKTEELEKSVINAGQSMEKINKLWRYRTRGLRSLFILFFLLSSLLLGWVGFEVCNPEGAMRLLAKTHIRLTGKTPDFSFLAPFIEKTPGGISEELKESSTDKEITENKPEKTEETPKEENPSPIAELNENTETKETETKEDVHYGNTVLPESEKQE